MSRKVEYSFVVPSYRGKGYVGRCLKSILDDVRDEKVEVIVVLNGPEDGSEEIARKIAEANPNVVVEHSEKGVSNARNVGMKRAAGEYLLFVDVDDEWMKGGLAAVRKAVVENEADLYSFGCVRGKFGEGMERVETSEKSGLVGVAEAAKWMFEAPTRRMSLSGKVFRTEIVRKAGVEFDTGIRYSEDSEFLIRYLAAAEKVFVDSAITYRQVPSAGSAMHKFDVERSRQHINSVVASERVIKNDARLKENFEKYVLTQLSIVLVHETFDMKNPAGFWEEVGAMKKLTRERVFAEALRKMKLKDCLKVRFLPELLIKMRLYVVCGMVCKARSMMNYKKAEV